MKFKPFNVIGHTATLDNIDIRRGIATFNLRRRWWAPLPLALAAASVVRRRWAPFVFAYALVYFTVRR